jgi:hypothetical protein
MEAAITVSLLLDTSELYQPGLCHLNVRQSDKARHGQENPCTAPTLEIEHSICLAPRT